MSKEIDFLKKCIMYKHLNFYDLLKKYDNFTYISEVLPTNIVLYLLVESPIIYNEFSISREKDRITTQNYFNNSIVKEFNCNTCYLTEKDSLIWNVDAENNSQLIPEYTEIIPNNPPINYCKNTTHFNIYPLQPEIFYNQLTITTVSHINTNCFYTNKDLFTSVYGLLHNQNNITAFHNEMNKIDHFYFNITKNYNHISSNYRNYEFVDFPFITLKNNNFVKVARIDDPVQKGVIFMANNIYDLFNCVNKIYTKIYSNNSINNTYYLSETMFFRENMFFIALFLYEKQSGTSFLPNEAGLIVIDFAVYDDTDLGNHFYEWNEDMLNISNIDNFNNIYKDYLTDPKHFFDSPVVTFNPDIIYSKDYKKNLLSNFPIEIIYNNFMETSIINILNIDFNNRNNYNDYIKYKIFLTIIFRGIKNKNIQNITNKKELFIIGNIFKLEIQYISKILSINTNLSFLKGDSLVELLKLSTENNFFIDMINIDKRIGDPSAYGQVYKTQIKSIGDLAVKFTINNKQADLEYLINKDINRLRVILIHFMYAYGIVKCIDEIKKDDTGNITLVNNNLCKKNISLNMCDVYSKNIRCNNSNSYILVELLQNPISLSTFINKINPKNKRDIKNFFSIMSQITFSLKIAQMLIGFNHNDLHLGNVLLLPNPNKDMLFTYKLDKVYNVGVYDYIPIIIDFGNSRTNNTENLVKEYWRKMTTTKFFNELYIFNENSDILSMILGIKAHWYNRFHDKTLEYNNIIPLMLKNIKFPEVSVIDIFLNTISYYPGTEIVNNIENNVINYYTFILKNNFPHNMDYKGIDDILYQLIIIQENIIENQQFDIVYNWGLTDKAGPLLD